MNKMALFIPVFLFLAFIEWLITRKKKSLFTKENSIMNVCLGAIDQICSLANFLLFILFLDYLYQYRIFNPKITWYHFVLAYIAVDFVSYWYHRFSHRVNILWAGHITHHSSSYFNFTNGFRTSPFQGLGRIIFWGILPILGFSSSVLFTTFIVSGIYDFFLHTQNFPKIKWLETILITPSLHKVHHGKNDVYLDKNYGSTFVIWDKLFGTFEDESETVLYGIKSSEYKDNDPINAIFFQYNYLWKMMKNTISFKDKIKLLIMPPDWLPKNIKETKVSSLNEKIKIYPLHKIYALYQFVFSGIGIIFILVYRAYFNLTCFIMLSTIFLSGMIIGTRIFNKVISNHFITNEIIRNLIFIVALLIALKFFSYKSIFVILSFLCISLIFIILLLYSYKEKNK